MRSAGKQTGRDAPGGRGLAAARAKAGPPRSGPAPVGPATSGLTNEEADTLEAVVALHDAHHSETSRLQRAIDFVTRYLGRPVALLLLTGAAASWAGLAALAGDVHAPAFAWLELVATMTALLVALLILVTQTHENRLAERRAQLTLELALLADRKNAKIIALIEELRRDAPDLADRADPESDDMAAPADLGSMAKAIDARGQADP